MRTNFQMLNELKDWSSNTRGFVTKDEMDHISEVFELENRDILDLRNLRDFVVAFFALKGYEEQENMDWDEHIKSQDKMSAICATIDSKLVLRGEEV